MGIFVFKVGLGLLAFAWKPWLGILFLVTYGLYVKRELSNDEESLASEDLEPLAAPRDTDPALSWAITQTVLALVVIAGASHVFVNQIETLAWPWALRRTWRRCCWRRSPPSCRKS